MRTSRLPLAGLAALTLAALAACGQSGSTGIAGQQLVVLEDDRQLQTVDNVIPAIHAASAEPALIDALDAVSAVLDTPTLIDLNKQVVIDRNTSSEVAAAFIEEADPAVAAGSGSGDVVVGAGNFPESATLAEIYAGALREAGYSASVRTIGNRETYLPALIGGELTIVPEYVGTLTEFLNKRANGPDAEAVASGDLDATVEALRGLGEEAGLAFGEPAEAADQNAFAVTQAFAEEHGVSTLSDLAEWGGEITLGGPPECPERPFCQPGLEETYGLEIVEFVSLDTGGPLTKTALRQGEITLGLVFSSDAEFATTD
jgi:osmoprotectant transport system substrate-binding protein